MTNLIHLYLDEKTGITQDGLEKLRAWAMVQEDQFRPDYVSTLHPADRRFMDSSQTTAAWHFPAFLALTFGAMVVWPVLGIAASSSLFDRISEAVLFLGGITALLLLPVYIILPQSETVFGIAIITVWVLIWIGGSVWFTSGSRTRRAQVSALAVLSGISLGQSALAFLMILGKNI